ncbi:TPA: nucleotide exchange factor GrpE [Candidatus Sumerlaeota bacterium]|jgi:molecular chaperone GrpE|nr:nucleotide exchange factor GrpE [Candidatus Sumerlaeota bacterium]
MQEEGSEVVTKPDGRRHRRAKRVRLHPHRAHQSEREAFLEKTLEAALHKLRNAGKSAAQPQGENVATLRDQVLRSRAELDNFRKRVTREKEDLEKFAAQKFVTAIIPALDSFDHALAALEQSHDAQTLAEGVLAIHQQLHQALVAQGVEPINPLGQAFDPNEHEALAVEKTEEQPHNSVINVFQNGYKLNGRVLRPARVRIAQKP